MALQTPSLCLNDPVLRQGAVLTDALGLPLAATGNVVVVFRMRLAEGDVALRCLTRKASFEVLERRYRALIQHLEQVDAPAFVPCTYRPDEILVAGARYPVVEMPWTPGLQLHRYIEQHLHEPDALQALVDRWRVVMRQLGEAGLAHGDLSDGNVLVDEQGQIHLVDHDAAFVPALTDDPPQEVGKPDYQHPDRLDPESRNYGYYAANLDAFAALTVYLSLRAIAEDADRWRCYHTGENLIFEQADFKNPGNTPIWLDLGNSQSDEVKQLVEILESFCRASVADLPTLEDALRGRLPRRRESRPRPRAIALAEDKAPVPPPETPPAVTALDEPETRSDLTALLRKLYLSRIAAVILFALVLLLAWRGQARSSARTLSLSGPSEAIVGDLLPEDLPGFYTGYATSLDGVREPMALTIDTLYTYPGSAEVRFSYSVNWKSHHVGGVGSYNRGTGHIDLESHYLLYVARTTADEVVLASLLHREQRPLVMVNKRRTP